METIDRIPIAQWLNWSSRMRLHTTVLIAVAFLAVYSKLVCPFIDNLDLLPLLSGLVAVAVLQVGLREWLLRRTPVQGLSLGRFGFYLSLGSWLAAGVVAMLLHIGFYPHFPWHSHVKLLVGYWVLGGGMLAQLEYAMLERRFRCHGPPQVFKLQERLAQRLLETFTIFSLAPAIAMLLLVVRFSYSNYNAAEFGNEVLFLTSFFVVIAVVVAHYWGKTLREDTDRILDGLSEICEGHFDVDLHIGRADELGLVAIAINSMAKGLNQRERIREAFGYFVSPEIAERFIQEYLQTGKGVKMGGNRTEVTIIMCDLRNFTPLSEALSPEQITECLNSYFQVMVAVVRQHGGIVDKFIGDAIMAVFGLVEGDEDHAVAAVRAARDMVNALEAFNRDHPLPDGLGPLRNGVGVHTGEVIAGYIGSPDRLEFTVVGRTVNLAARLEAQAKRPYPPLLFSPAVAERVGGHLAVCTIGEVSLKGVEQAITLHSLTEFAPLNATIPLQQLDQIPLRGD